MTYERAHLKTMEGYTPGVQPDTPVIKLNTNENPYPPGPAVVHALTTLSAGMLQRYPDPLAAAFRANAARLRFVMDGMIRRGIRDKDASTLREGNAIGQRKNLRLGRKRVFGVGAGKAFRNVNALACFHFFHTFADGLDDACSIGSGRVGKRWQHCVIAGARVSVGGIDTGCVDFYQYLSGGGLGCGEFFELENFRTAELANENGFHVHSTELNFEKAAGLKPGTT